MEKYDYEESLIQEENFGYRIMEDHIVFRVWAPDCDELNLLVYDDGDTFHRKEYHMKRENDGIWKGEFPVSLKNKYYTYQVWYGDLKLEVVDPYAITTGTSGKRAMIIDLNETNIEGWDEHPIPQSIAESEAIIYETHMRDFTVHESAQVKYKGKFLGFSESHESPMTGVTGIAHLQELGITHLHILPVFEFATVDDRNPDEYNWGYDPYLFNTLEGSYSLNPSDGRERIREFKTLVKACHEKGIRVVLDVVYNHTYFSQCSNFNRLVPNYYYRLDENGNFSNGSGVGNEIATEKGMVRKFIIESLLFWLRTYKIDGFRFDLMGLMDTVTMAKIVKALREERPDILIYGEPWTGGLSALAEERRMTKGKQQGLSVALFNDDFRNAIRGDNHGHEEGYICGNLNKIVEIKKGIAGSIAYSEEIIGFAKNGNETVNYVSCHDDLILSDKLKSEEGCIHHGDMVKMNRLALSILLTSFGIPFIQAGTEFMRTKKMVHNSYNASDEINQIDWTLKMHYREMYDYIRGLIAFRKESGIFRDTDEKSIKACLKFYESEEGLLVYSIAKNQKVFYIFHNVSNQDKEYGLEKGKFKILANDLQVFKMEDSQEKEIESLRIPPLSTFILMK